MNVKKVLVVDDEVSITRLLKMNLEATGRFCVRVENSGDAALKAAREYRPDIVVTDVMMPDMSGGELAEELQRLPTFRRMPILFITAAVRPEELGGPTGRVGGRHFIAKPVKIRDVVSTIDNLIMEAETGQKPGQS